MDPADTPLYIVMAILLVCSAFASASETAFFGITHAQRALLKRTNPRLGRTLESLLARPRELLMQVLLMNMAVNVAYFIVASVLTLHAETGLKRVVISLGSLTVIILVGEVFAKLFASGATLLFLRVGAPVHLLIRGPIDPLLCFLDVWVISPLSRLVAPPRHDHRHAGRVTPEQLGSLIDMSAGEGVIDRGEQQLLTSIVAMGQLRVEQVMTPRVDLVHIPPTISRRELARVCRQTGRTRLLVCADGIDSGVMGMIDARRVFEGRSVTAALEQVLYVPEQSRIDVLMEQLRLTGRGVAVCVDEHGGVAGIITIGDIAKELIEGIEDPQDDPASEVEMIGVGRWIVPGRLSIREWALMFSDRSIIEHTKRVNTLGGLIMVLLDRIPEVGDETRIGDITLRVAHMRGRAIDRVEVEIIADPDASGPSKGGAP